MSKETISVLATKNLPSWILYFLYLHLHPTNRSKTEQTQRIENLDLAKKKNSANYIDLARFIAIYAVVLGHFHPFIGIDNIVGRKLIYMFHMPIFFIISGMLSKPTPVKKVAYSLLIPYLIYNIISIIKLDIISLLTVDALQLVNSPTWFFMALFVIKVMADHIN